MEYLCISTVLDHRGAEVETGRPGILKLPAYSKDEELENHMPRLPV